MKKQLVYLVVVVTLLSNFASVSPAQKKPKPRRLDVPTLIETLNYGNCSPVNELAVVTIQENGDLMLGSSKIEKANLIKEVRNRICDKAPSDQIIYIKADSETAFSQIIEIIRLGREIKVDDFGLNILDAIDLDTILSASMIKVPEAEEFTDQKVKAHSLALFVSLEKNGSVHLNSKPETLDSLSKRLKQIFLTRKQKKIYIQGSRDVEKTVFISADEKAKLGDVIKIIEAVKNTGAFPIGLDVDNYYEKIVF